MSNNRALVTELQSFAESQHGVVSVNQAKALTTPGVYKREFASLRWQRVERGIYRVAGSPYTPASMAMVWLLRAGPGAVVSHYSAMALWQVPAQPLLPLHVLRMRSSNGIVLPPDRITVHRVRSMHPDHVTTVDGFAVTTPSRTIVDMAAVEPLGRVGRWLDRLWSKQLVSYHSVHQVMANLQKKGRTGIPMIRDLLAERGPFYVAPQSGLESRLNQLCAEAGLGGVRRQANVGGEAWLARTDFRLEGTPILIEVQSDLFHASLTSRTDDARRTSALRQAGFVVFEVWERELWQNPNVVIGQLRDLQRRHAA